MKPSCNFGCCWSFLSIFFPQDGNYYDATIHAVLPGGRKLSLWMVGGFAGLQRFPKKSHGLPLNSENWWQNSFISNVELWENCDFGTSLWEKSRGTKKSSKVWCSHGTTRTSLTPWEVLWLLIGFDHDPMATPMLWPKRGLEMVNWLMPRNKKQPDSGQQVALRVSNMRDPATPKTLLMLDTHTHLRERLLDRKSLFHPFFFEFIIDEDPFARIVRSEPSVELVAMIPSTASSRQFRGKDGMGSMGHGINGKTHFAICDIWLNVIEIKAFPPTSEHQPKPISWHVFSTDFAGPFMS